MFGRTLHIISEFASQRKTFVFSLGCGGNLSGTEWTLRRFVDFVGGCLEKTTDFTLDNVEKLRSVKI